MSQAPALTQDIWRWVRLKPYDKARGHVLKRYRTAGQYFEQHPDPDRAWKRYDITNPSNAQLVRYLETCTQEVTTSVPAFDITDTAGRERILRQEKLTKLGAQPSMEAPQRLRPPESAVATPIGVSTPEPVHAVDLAAPMPEPAPLPPQVLEDEQHHAASRAAAAEEKAEAQKAAAKKAAPKKKATPKKRSAKRAPAAKKR
jgi:hypothetical protein